GAERQVRRNRLAVLVVDLALDRIGPDRGERHLGARIDQAGARLEQFAVLEAVGREDEDLRFVDHRHKSLRWRDSSASTDSRRAAFRNDRTVDRVALPLWRTRNSLMLMM